MGGTKEQLLCRTQARCHKDLRCCVVVEVQRCCVMFQYISTCFLLARSTADLSKILSRVVVPCCFLLTFFHRNDTLQLFLRSCRHLLSLLYSRLHRLLCLLSRTALEELLHLSTTGAARRRLCRLRPCCGFALGGDIAMATGRWHSCCWHASRLAQKERHGVL
jgi:hypothetical protein